MGANSQAGSGIPAEITPGSVSESRLFQDILKQPAQLAASLSHMLGAGKPALDAAAAILRGSRPFVISGIGASWHAGMAMQAELLACGRPGFLIDASELLHSAAQNQRQSFQSPIRQTARLAWVRTSFSIQARNSIMRSP